MRDRSVAYIWYSQSMVPGDDGAVNEMSTLQCKAVDSPYEQDRDGCSIIDILFIIKS